MDGLVPLLCLAIPTVVVILFLIVNDQGRQAREKEQREAHVAYQAALTKLKTRPADATLRQLALEAGRFYSNLTRDKKGVTMFDEVALKNDLDAASAGANVAASVAAPPAADTGARLRRLDELKAQGLVSEAEHAAQRQKILDEV